jgi:hypothetical protein
VREALSLRLTLRMFVIGALTAWIFAGFAFLIAIS